MSKTVVVVTGIPGVGKSTVLNLATKELIVRGFNVKVFNFGDFMFFTLHSGGLVRSRDEIRRLPIDVQCEAQISAAKEIRREIDSTSDEGKHVFIVDTHAVIKTTSGYWPGLPEDVVKCLRPKAIVIIEADVNEIIARQMRDRSRYRADYADVEILNELLLINRIYAISSATLVNAVVRIIRNKEGQPEKAAQELADLVMVLGNVI